MADCVEKRWISLSDYNPSLAAAVATTIPETEQDPSPPKKEDNQGMTARDTPENNNNQDDKSNDPPTKRLVVRRLQQAMVPGIHLCKVQIATEIYKTKVKRLLDDDDDVEEKEYN